MYPKQHHIPFPIKLKLRAYQKCMPNYNTLQRKPNKNMNLKKFYIAPIKGYQYISKMLPASCRYYPSCSEYATWQFEFNSPHKALSSSTLRILRCNQFFKGGIDYPLVDYTPPKHPTLLPFHSTCAKIEVLYWLVPQSIQSQNTKYYVLKDFDAIKRAT